MKSMKIRIHPAYLFAAAVILLPVLIVYLRWRAHQEETLTYRPFLLDRLRVELPVEVIETRVMPGGLHYIGAGDGQREIVAALLPAPENSSAWTALREGPLAAVQLFHEILSPAIPFEKLDCAVEIPSRVYHLSGKSGEIRRLSGRMRLDEAQGYAIVVVTLANTQQEADEISNRVFRSVRDTRTSPSPGVAKNTPPPSPADIQPPSPPPPAP